MIDQREFLRLSFGFSSPAAATSLLVDDATKTAPTWSTDFEFEVCACSEIVRDELSRKLRRVIVHKERRRDG